MSKEYTYKTSSVLSCATASCTFSSNAVMKQSIIASGTRDKSGSPLMNTFIPVSLFGIIISVISSSANSDRVLPTKNTLQLFATKMTKVNPVFPKNFEKTFWLPDAKIPFPYLLHIYCVFFACFVQIYRLTLQNSYALHYCYHPQEDLF